METSFSDEQYLPLQSELCITIDRVLILSQDPRTFWNDPRRLSLDIHRRCHALLENCGRMFRLGQFTWFVSSLTFFIPTFEDVLLFIRAVIPWKPTGEEIGHFIYTRDNHTSVLGLREIVDPQKVKIHCLEHEEAFRIFAGNAAPSHEFLDGNSLFVYSAQCNFSGCKYPLMWINKVHDGILNDSIVASARYRIFSWSWNCIEIISVAVLCIEYMFVFLL